MVPMKAARLVIRHYDGRETVVEDARYWPYGGGRCLDLFDEAGQKVREFDDVEHTFVGVPA